MPFVDRHFHLEHPMPAFLFLMRHCGVRQSEAQKIVATGRLKIDGHTMNHSGTVISGNISVKLFDPQPRGIAPLFVTPDFAVYEKPSGVLVHPTTFRTPYSMLDEIRHQFGANANALHRIDLETSGLLLVSRNKRAEKMMKPMFERSEIKKSYLAWVRGRITAPLRIEAPLRQNTDFSTIKLKMFVDSAGKPSPLKMPALRVYWQKAKLTHETVGVIDLFRI